MTLEDYSRNVRGINDGESFSPEFVVRFSYRALRRSMLDIDRQQTIYDQIRKREIVMPEEHTGQVGFEYAWKELLARSKQAGMIESTAWRAEVLYHPQAPTSRTILPSSTRRCLKLFGNL
jgi:Sec7-like guanine-nucleotide exchange factor